MFIQHSTAPSKEIIPLSILASDCHMSPDARWTITDVVTGEVSSLDCPEIKRIIAEKQAAREAAKKVAAENLYVIYSQSSAGKWKRVNVSTTAEQGRSMAKRQCMDHKIPGVPPNTAVKVVAPDGQEEVTQCPPKK